MNRQKTELYILLLLVLIGGINRAEPITALDIDTADTVVTAAGTMVSDSVKLIPPIYQPGPDTLLVSAFTPTEVIRPEGPSPTITMFKSVAFPGWGQYTNRRYIKAGLVFAVESFFIYRAIHFADLASEWRDKWQSAPDSLKGGYFSQYADYRDTRNSNLWYTAMTIFLSMFDAYVDAHLRDFPDKVAKPGDINFDIIPGQETTLAIVYRF